MRRSSWVATIETVGLRGLLLMLALLGGCGRSYPNYGEFGPDGHHFAGADVDAPPVIVLHGIKGAKLVKVNDPQNDYKSDQTCPSLAGPNDLKPMWGYTGSTGLKSTYERLALYPDPARLPNDKPWDDQQYYSVIDPLKNIKPDKVLTTFWVGWDVFPVFEFELYGHLVDFLKDDPVSLEIGNRLFLFAYDWRLDNRVASILLANCLTHYEKSYLDFHARLALSLKDPKDSEEAKQIDEPVKRCIEARKNPDDKDVFPSCLVRWKTLRERGALDHRGNVRFTIVTHSMGGLLGRYFSDGLGYRGRINKLVLFGSPNQGGMDALRAMLEGEHPPTFWHYLGINWFSAVDTTKIHLSFGSIFQLLPRYRDAVVDLQTGGNLTDDYYGMGGSEITPQIIANWKDLLSFKGVDLGKYAGLLDQHLKFHLTSARCFHLAITDPPTPCNDEDQRIRRITDYLQQYYPSVRTLPPKGDENHRPPIINFGGQCDKTLATMAIERTIDDGKVILKKAVFLDQDPIELLSRWYGTVHSDLVGDNRVPVKSFDYPHKVRSGDASFLVCKNHVGIIKDENLLYNLLRTIFY